MKKLIVDQKICIGCGTCVALAPEVFQLNDEGKAEVKAQGLKGFKGSGVQSEIQEVIESCPVDAIKWEEEKSKK